MKSFLTCIFLAVSVSLFSQTPQNGLYEKKDEKTGKTIYKGEFKNGKPFGSFKYFYPNDTVKAIMNFKNEGKTAYAKLFHQNGKQMGQGKYIGEAKDSVWLYYDELGVLISKDVYSMGKKNGTSYVYLPDGVVSEFCNYKMDVKEGPYKQFYNAQLVKSEGSYLNGELDGKVSYYFPNKVEAAVGYYIKGNKNGPWIYKNNDGTIKSKELFKNGVQASKKETEAFFLNHKIEQKSQPNTQGKKPAKK
ncbi:MAG: hypothetical protein JSU07_03775 [Bacteroidetes bacterium]|nr:hypothetical protein [Bacteroidota bacterium]